MIVFGRPGPPGPDLSVDPRVQVRDRAGRDSRAPQSLGDVLDRAHRDTGQIHLDQGLHDRALAPAVAFDDRRLESLLAKLGDF